MSPDRWERVKELFDEALEKGAAERTGVLEGADAEIREQVEALLKEHQSATTAFLRTSPAYGPYLELEPLREGITLKGRYKVEGELGRGGSGVVHLARDLQLMDRLVVVKFLQAQAQRHPVLLARFRQELEALARIRHPGVVSLLDVGEQPGGEMYLVMEYVDGETLRSLITEGGIELSTAARLIRQVCEALEAAHAKGIYHRDLKPENIMLLRGGEAVKLIDFGIAKVEQAQIKSHTETWTFMGTVNYVAPEQLLGKSGASTDIWALGVVAYELVTGQRPFRPETPFHLYEMQRAQRMENPARLRPDLPEGARAAIVRALSFEVEKRQATAAQFAREFCDGMKGGISWRRAGRRVAWAASGLAVAVVALAGWQWRGSASAPTAAGGAPGVPALDLSINTPLGVAVDGRGNVYFTEYANNRAWKVDAGGRATVLAGTGVAGSNGDGGAAAKAQIQAPRVIAFDREKYLYLVETTTDRIRRIDLISGVIDHVMGNGQPRFNGDGRRGVETSFSEGLGLGVERDGSLLISDTNNHRIRRLSAVDGRVTTFAGTGEKGESGNGGPAIRARMSRPAGLAVHPSGDVYFFDADTERIRRIRNGVIEAVAGSGGNGAMEGDARSVRLGASTGIAMDQAGKSLYFTDERFDTLRKLDLETMRVTIVAGTGTQGYSGDGGSARAAMMANPTGVAVDSAGNLYVAEAMGNRIRKVSADGKISTFAGGKVPYAMNWGGTVATLLAPVAPFPPQ